jgi:four helix bundle protein
MQDVERLRVYSDVKGLARVIFIRLDKVPMLFDSKSQLLRSVGSIGVNLAEFSAMNNKNQKIYKLTTCIGECSEAIFWIEVMTGTIFTEEECKFYVGSLVSIRKQLHKLYEVVTQDPEPKTGD